MHRTSARVTYPWALYLLTYVRLAQRAKDIYADEACDLVPISAAVIGLALLLALNLKARRFLILICKLVSALVSLVIPTKPFDAAIQSLEGTLRRLQARRVGRSTGPEAGQSSSNGSDDEALKTS